MTKASAQECRLILRQLKPTFGITETQVSVISLEELFNLCVGADPQLIDRLLIIGQDAHGRQRLLSFTFQSISDHNQL